MALSMSARILLASQSPRRRQLLEQIGIGFALIRVNVEEQQRSAESPEQFVVRMAMEKAAAGRLASAAAGTGEPVLGADTIVVLGDEVLGKPVDRADGLAMLARLSSQTHEVLSAVALAGDPVQYRLSRSRVEFRAIPADERAVYWATGEPLDKAGAYAIQGRAAVFVRHIEGSYSGVMGLPLYETAELLAEVDIFPFENKE